MYYTCVQESLIAVARSRIYKHSVDKLTLYDTLVMMDVQKDRQEKPSGFGQEDIPKNASKDNSCKDYTGDETFLG